VRHILQGIKLPTLGLLVLCTAMCWVIWMRGRTSPVAYEDDVTISPASVAATTEALPEQFEEGSLCFLSSRANLGAVRGKVGHSFPFENRGKCSVRIVDVQSSCACNTSKPDRDMFLTGETGVVRVETDLDRQSPGLHRFTIVVKYQDATERGESPVRIKHLTLELENRPFLLLSPAHLSFRVVGETTESAQFRLVDYHQEPVAITAIETTSEHLRVRIKEVPRFFQQGWSYLLEASFDGKNLGAGHYSETITLRMSDPEKPSVQIPVSVQRLNRIRVAPKSLLLRPSRPGLAPEGKICIWDAEGAPVQIESVNCRPGLLKASFDQVPAARPIIVLTPVDSGARPQNSSSEVHIRVLQPCKEEICVAVTWHVP